MKKQLTKKAFTLLELSMVIVIISILIAGIVSGKRLITQSTLKSAQSLTKSSSISSIPDLKLWLEPTLDESITGAATGANLSNNDLISSWNDLSGNGIKLTQSTGANQPKYLLNGINNLPSISFDGTSDVLNSTAVPIAKGSNQYTIIAVLRTGVLSGSKLPVGQSQLVTSGAGEIFFNSANLQFSGLSNASPAITTLTANTNYIIAIVIDNQNVSGNIFGYVNSNNSSNISSASPSLLSIGADFFSLGGRTDSAGVYEQYADVLISEILVFNRNLTPSEVAVINNYLSKKYNITLS